MGGGWVTRGVEAPRTVRRARPYPLARRSHARGSEGEGPGKGRPAPSLRGACGAHECGRRTMNIKITKVMPRRPRRREDSRWLAGHDPRVLVELQAISDRA